MTSAQKGHISLSTLEMLGYRTVLELAQFTTVHIADAKPGERYWKQASFTDNILCIVGPLLRKMLEGFVHEYC